MSVLQAIAAAERERMENEKRLQPGPETLRRLAAKYFKKHEFKPGDLVVWKIGMKDSRFPEYGEPAVVLDVLPGNIDTERDATSNCYREPRDVRIGLCTAGDKFNGFWMDSGRFEPYPEPSLDESPEPQSCEG